MFYQLLSLGSFLVKILSLMDNSDNPEIPKIFYEGKYSKDDITFFKNEKNLVVVDLFKAQSLELAKITNPFRSDKHKSKEYIDSFICIVQENSDEKGDWIHFPWTNVILHQVKKEDYLKIITDRNIGFISRTEQNKLLTKNICIVGLSTGSSIALGLVHSGIGSHFTLADFDSIDSSDLNRTFYDLSDVGLLKVAALSRKMYQINPYLEIKVVKEGLLQENQVEFFSSPSKKFDVIFDEASQLTPGVLLRQYAKVQRIPVVTMGNLGYGVYVAAERYDLNPELEMYFGFQSDELKKYLKQGDFFGLESSTLDLMSTGKIKKEILKIVKNKSQEYTETPQLFSALSLNASLVTPLVRKILSGYPTKKEYFFKYSF